MVLNVWGSPETHDLKIESEDKNGWLIYFVIRNVAMDAFLTEEGITAIIEEIS